MTNQEIIEFIDKNLKGQGTAVDLSGKLPEILAKILQQIVDMTSAKKDTDQKAVSDWIAAHPNNALYLGNYAIGGAGWDNYLTWLAGEWANVGALGHIDVPWGPKEMVSVINVDTQTASFGGVVKLIRNGKVYKMQTSGQNAWVISELVDAATLGDIATVLDTINGEVI